MSLPPNTTLYVKNLNDQVQKDELKAQLYNLFLPYGKILDVTASKTTKMRGQAFVTFEDLKSATTALRAWEGEVFYDKPMHIEYAKTKSYASLKQEDPTFLPPSLAGAKRPREEDTGDENRVTKKERAEDNAEDDGDEEMEIE